MATPVDGAGKADGRCAVLVVEDQYLIAEEMCDLLNDLGCGVVGPVATIEKAMILLAQGRPDAALLDINLGDSDVFPLAEELRSRGIPFAFVTGYDTDMVPEHFSDVPCLNKPVDSRVLKRVLDQQIRK